MFKIKSKKMLTNNICYMDILCENIAKNSLPGQFLIINPNKTGERIPLTICNIDKQNKTIGIVFQIVGKTTQKMSEYNINENFNDVVGPLGKPSTFCSENINNIKQEKYIFVAGGVGTAPIFPQIKWFHEHNIDFDIIIGAKTKEQLFFIDKIKQLTNNIFITTDDGSYGQKGNVVELLEKLVKENHKNYTKAIIIGPLIMMKFGVIKCNELKIPSVVSMNPLMVDGTGMCGACRVTIDNQTKFACVDGPEFDGTKVNFDEAIFRQKMYNSNYGNNILDIQNFKIEHAPNCPIECHKNSQKITPQELNPNIRNKNFLEVTQNYTKEEAIKEASRCLNCKKPTCVSGCPVNIDIPKFIQKIKSQEFEEAGNIISNFSAFPSICGRVCPQEKQCEAKCILKHKNCEISIGNLERFVGDYNINKTNKIILPEKQNIKIAIIGSGPAGLSAAYELIKLNYDVYVYESLHKLGGVLSYGIPEFRLPKTIVDTEIQKLENLGVKFVTNCIIGKTITIQQLQNEFDFKSIFIATGAGLPRFLNIPGENLNGVISANEFLTRINLMKANYKNYDTPIKIGKKVAVIGGGNVAMDAARTAKRLGCDVTIIYRRSLDEMPARKAEIIHAQEENINFELLSNPVEFIGTDNWVKQIKLIKMKLGEKDFSGRASFEIIKNSEYTLNFDTAIIALGTIPNPMITSSIDIKTNTKNCIEINNNTLETSIPGIFAGGDAVSGAATVILAMEAGKKAAHNIHKYITITSNK